MVPTEVSGVILTAQEFRDSLHLRYGGAPPSLPSKCHGFAHAFSVRHSMICMKGGLIHQRHNEIRDERTTRVSQALSSSAVRDEPLVTTLESLPSADTSSDCPQGSPVEHTSERGDLLPRHFGDHNTDCIVDARVTDLNMKSARKQTRKRFSLNRNGNSRFHGHLPDRPG